MLPQRSRLGFQPSLEGLRGVAIVLVVFHHSQALLAPWLVGAMWQGGFIGVEVFFVLSGFLITSLLLEGRRSQGTIALGRFYRRRAVRLLPALGVVMIAEFLYAGVARGQIGNELRGLGFVVAYAVNWSISLGGPSPSALGQTWSLAVEEQFYLIWPVALLIGLRSRRRWVVPAIIGAAITASIVTRVAVWMHVHSYLVVYPQTETYIDALMIGAALAYALFHGWAPGRWVNWVALAATAMLVSAFYGANAAPAYGGRQPSDWFYYWGFTAVAVSAAVIIVAALQPATPIHRLLAHPWLRFLGRISYGLYLWHVLVIVAISLELPALPAVEAIAVAILLSVGLATISYHALELPLLTRERRHTGRQAPGPDAREPAASGEGGTSPATPLPVSIPAA